MPGDNVYIPIPGDTSGDLWHLAAAQILSSQYSQNRKFIVPVVGLPAKAQKSLTDNERRMQDKTYRQAQTTFDYLTSIGLECLLMLVQVGNGVTSRANLEKALWYTKDDDYDLLYGAMQPSSFTSIVQSLEPIVISPGDLKDIWCPRAERVVHLRTATTIAMSFLEPEASRFDRMKYLADRMYSRRSQTKDMAVEEGAQKKKQKLDKLEEEAAQKNKQELDQLIKSDMAVEAAAQKKKQSLDQLIKTFQNGKVSTRIVLENWRIGEVNAQTNSNSSISEQLETLMKAVDPEKLAIIRVAAVPDQQSINKVDWPKYLDIYGKQGNPNDPGLDARAQSRFWNLVSQDARVVGLFGGRSGSMDIAAFSGMTCFFWDEPWLPFVAGTLNDLIMAAMDKWKILSFVSQTLRSLELSPIMSIGLAVERDKAGTWKRINDDALSGWLHMISKNPPNVPYTGKIWPACGKTVNWGNEASWFQHSKSGCR